MLEYLEDAQRPFSAQVVMGEQRDERRRRLLTARNDDAHNDDRKNGDKHASECAVHDVEEHNRRSGHPQRAGTAGAGVACDSPASQGRGSADFGWA